jgi:hypothetical protein
VIEICCARKVLPVIKAVATFGLDLLEPADSAITALNGFLAGILLGFDPARSAGLAASYCIEIDDRRSEFGVAGVNLTAAKESPAVTVTTTAADLIAARWGRPPPSARPRCADANLTVPMLPSTRCVRHSNCQQIPGSQSAGSGLY